MRFRKKSFTKITPAEISAIKRNFSLTKGVGKTLEERVDNKMATKLDVEYSTQEITTTKNKLTTISTLAQATYSGFETIIYPVREGEKYKVTATNVLGSFGFWSDTAIIGEPYNRALNDEVVVVPTGATRMVVNGRPGGGFNAPIVIKKFSPAGDSVPFWQDFNAIKNQVKDNSHLGVHKNGNSVGIFMKGYAHNIDLKCSIKPKTGNSLPDIQGWFRCQNLGIEVLNDDVITGEAIINSGTDFLSPSAFSVVNNADGDFPNDRTKLTGGWHTYGGTSDAAKSATARNVSLKVFCDGKELVNGEKARGRIVVVDIVNRLQACNTTKADGGGREALEQHFRLTFADGFKCKVEGEITPLEDIRYATYYGVSMVCMREKPLFWVGCRANRQAQIPANAANRCGDKYCTGIKQIGDKDTILMGYNPNIDLGSLYANQWKHSCILGSGKAYMVLISANNSDDESKMLSLKANDRIFWEGYYDFYPTV